MQMDNLQNSREFAGRLLNLRNLDMLLMAAYRCLRSAYIVGDEAAAGLAYPALERAKVCRRQAEGWFRARGIEVTLLDSEDLLLKERGEPPRYYSVLFHAEGVRLIPVHEPVLQQG